MVTLGVTGDVMLGRGADRVQRAEGRPPEAVWGDVLPRLRALDGLLVNLECCLSTRGAPGAALTTRATSGRVRTALDVARESDPDVLVASLHWGPNVVERPPERFRRFARWLVDEGVNLVHGHSAHVFQGIEVVGESLVLYDTGDVVDDYAVDPALRNDRGFCFEVDLGSAGFEGVRLVPTEIREYAVRRASGRVAEWCLDRMERLSAEFGAALDRAGRTLVCRVGE